MQTANATAQDWTSESCPNVWWRHRVGGMRDELEVLHRTLGFSVGAKPRGVHIIVRSLALWKLSFVGFPPWEDKEPRQAHRHLTTGPWYWQVPPWAGWTLRGSRQERTEVSFRHPNRFCQKDTDCKVFSRLTTVYWKVHKTWTNESKYYCFCQTPQIRVTLAK